MKKLFELANIDYTGWYAKFKQLPFWTVFFEAISWIVWSFADIIIFYKEGYQGSYYSSPDHFGIWQWENPVLVVLAWWVIGVVSCLITYGSLALILSPIVKQVDATLSIEYRVKEMMKNGEK